MSFFAGAPTLRAKLDTPPILCYTKSKKGGDHMDYSYIKTQKDVDYFLEKTNSLHDGYIIGVQYTNDAITNEDENGYLINPDAKKLILRILVTSIRNTIVEIEFDGVLKWQIKDDQMDITETSVIFTENDRILWLDDVFANMNELKNGSYIIADSMKWRIVE